MKAVLALDQGTSSSRAMIFGEGGEVLARAQREFPQSYPADGWVEHDPERIWEDQLGVAVEALEFAGLGAKDVCAIGITNQRETTVVWDRKTGKPIHPAIVWQDRRTADACRRLRSAGEEPGVRSRTGLLLDPYFSATKLAWILDHVPGARDRARAGELAFGTMDSWLVYRLTDGERHVTDPSNASRTLLYDIVEGAWSPELLDLFDVPESLLPEVVLSSGVVGEARVKPLAGVPIAGIAGDQQAALFGQRCHAPGMAKNTYGTGCFLLAHTGSTPIFSSSPLLTTVAWGAEAGLEYALEGAVFTGGAVVRWLRDGLGLIGATDEVEPLARTEDDSGGIVLVPAFAGLGAPHWDPEARGVLCGITASTTAGHLARAALEGIAFQVADLLDGMSEEAALDMTELRVDGGGAQNDLLLQFQADILGCPVVRSAQTESTALGAAFLAGLATGVWEDRAALGDLETGDPGKEGRRFEPQMTASRAQELRRTWTRAVMRAKGWAAADDQE